jgi:hypothetical protein
VTGELFQVIHRSSHVELAWLRIFEDTRTFWISNSKPIHINHIDRDRRISSVSYLVLMLVLIMPDWVWFWNTQLFRALSWWVRPTRLRNCKLRSSMFSRERLKCISCHYTSGSNPSLIILCWGASLTEVLTCYILEQIRRTKENQAGFKCELGESFSVSTKLRKLVWCTTTRRRIEYLHVRKWCLKYYNDIRVKKAHGRSIVWELGVVRNDGSS